MDKPQREGVKAEDRVVAKFGGRKVPASGSGSSKGDVINSTEVFEVKSTDKASYSLKLSDLMVLRHTGYVESRKPVLNLTFNKTTRRASTHWVVISEDDYYEMAAAALSWNYPA